MQQRWPATENEAYAVYQCILKFDLYLRVASCVLHCDDKLLEPFLPKVLKFLSSMGGLWCLQTTTLCLCTLKANTTYWWMLSAG